MLSEEISIIKKKSRILPGNDRKDTLKSSQELSRPHPLWAQGYKGIKSFERLSLRGKYLWAHWSHRTT
jgi:hypothetical protein